MKSLEELLKQVYTVESNPLDAVELIKIAHQEYKEIVAGRVKHNNKIVLANIASWGFEGDSVCYVCLAGTAFYRATGEFYKNTKDVELRDYPGMFFLNELRWGGSPAWEILSDWRFVLPVLAEYYGLSSEELIKTLDEFFELNKDYIKTLEAKASEAVLEPVC